VFNYSPVVEALLKHGANVDQATTNGVTPIQAATENNHMDIVDMLREYDQRNKTMLGITALDNVSRDTDATLPLDLYEFMGKKDANGNYVGGRRRKTRKSRKTKKSKKSKKRRRL
jgi:ankyrin repeat protein